MATLVEAMTLEQFAALPEPADGSTLELIDGEVRCMSGGNSVHGTIIGELFGRLFGFVKANELGRVITNANFAFTLESPWSPVPDVAFVSRETFARIFRASAPFAGPPDLAVEVISPSNSFSEMTSKADAYLRGGARRVWLVSPESESVEVIWPDRTARIYRYDEVLSSDDAGFEVDGFELSLTELFAIAG